MLSRHTHVVPGRLGERRLRDALAAGGGLGHVITTLPGLAARLAGGFARAATGAEVRAALQEPPAAELTTLAGVAVMPGFARAAARTLQAAWHANVDLGERATAGGRWAELAALERHVAASLVGGALLPPRLVALARARVARAPRLTGPVTLQGLADVPPLYRPLVEELAGVVPVAWRGASPPAPAWLPATVAWAAPEPRPLPTATVVGCADPDHEALEALGWARELIASGRRPEEVLIAAVDTAAYDDAIGFLAAEAGIPLHAAHGVRALSTPVGQVVAALADALVRGPGQVEVRRLATAARRANVGPLGLVPEDWADELAPDAFLIDTERWRRALRPLAARESHQAEIIVRLVADLELGLAAARRVGARWLDGRAAELWRRAMADGPPGVLEQTLARLRVDDGVDPAAAVLWGPAAALTAWPRPHARLLGLSARGWPRRGSDEDPLLPERIRPGLVLRERSVTRQDGDAFAALVAAARTELVVSYPRRDARGRVAPRSHLLASLAGATTVEARRGAGDRAVTEAYRRAARPAELASDPRQRRGAAAYRAAYSPDLTPHDGVVRPDHPALAAALERVQSATSLRSLLLNPHGYVVRYALRWERPEPRTELLALDPAALGTLLHQVLERAARPAAGTDGAPPDVKGRVAAACRTVGSAWETRYPLPPEALWRKTLAAVEEWAVWSLTVGAPPGFGAESHVELRFGYAGQAAPADGLPWDPSASVFVPGTTVRVRGVIDRLDVDRAQRRVRVVDYKSGRPVARLGGLEGGAELQRTLYTAAVRQLLGADWDVAALLVHPRQRVVLPLEDPDSHVPVLTAAVTLAARSLLAGNALAGPALAAPFEDARLAFPAYGADRYLELKGAALAAARGELDELLGGAT